MEGNSRWTDLYVYDETHSDVVWAGYFDPNGSQPDWQRQDLYAGSLKLNEYWMDSFSESLKQNVILHELGHALGLGHSYLGNTMYLEVSPSNIMTTLGNQDVTDLGTLWPD